MVSLFSPVIAMFTSIYNTFKAANDWGNSAYKFVAGEHDETLAATVDDNSPTAGFKGQNSAYTEHKSNTMTHQRKLSEDLNHGIVGDEFKNDPEKTNSHRLQNTPT